MSSSPGADATLAVDGMAAAAAAPETVAAAPHKQSAAPSKAADKRPGRRSDRRNDDDDSERPVVVKDPLLSKRTVALHTGYVGTSYKGSCINRTLGHDVTIEQVLERAIFEGGLMLETNYGSFSRTRWSRASRTDKGVHSLGTVMGLRMLVDDRCYSLPNKPPGTQSKDVAASTAAASSNAAASSEAALPSTDPCAAFVGDVEGSSMAARINAHLPPDVRVFAVQKVNKKFNARHMCKDRMYDYYLPASLLGLKGDGGEQDKQKIAALREALNVYVGYKPFHNFTKRSHHEAERSSKHSARKAQRQGQQQEENATLGEDATAQATHSQAAGGGAAGGPSAEDMVMQEPNPPAMQTQEEGPTDLAKTVETTAAADLAKGGAIPAAAGAAAGEANTNPPGPANRQGQQGGQRGHGKEPSARGVRKRKAGDDDVDEEEGGSDSSSEGGGELEGDEDDVLAEFIAHDTQPADTADGQQPSAPGAAADQQGAVRPRRSLLLKFNEAPDPKDIIGKTYYRQIHSFTAEDPTPLVEGGVPCLKLAVHGQSFMLHHIRHMIGAAVAVARGLLPLELLQAAVSAPARVALPRAPPHTLILSGCSFHPFPKQHGTGDNDLINVTGPQLQLREGALGKRETFRQQVLLPALQQQVAETADWDKWSAALEAAYPFPEEEQQVFLTAYRRWVEVMKAIREAKESSQAAAEGEGEEGDGEEEGGRPGKRHRPTPQQRQRWGRAGGGRGRGRGRGGRRGS